MLVAPGGGYDAVALEAGRRFIRAKLPPATTGLGSRRGGGHRGIDVFLHLPPSCQPLEAVCASRKCQRAHPIPTEPAALRVVGGRVPLQRLWL